VLRLLFAIAFPLSAQTLQTTWGMTPAQVRAQVSAQVKTIDFRPPVELKDGLQYEADDARLLYTFAKNKLIRARYIFTAEHQRDLNDFIRDFQTTEAKLTERYGKPESDRAVWTDDSTQDEPKSYLDQDRATATGILPTDRYVGLAISLGHLKLYTQWSAGYTKIVHSLTGANGKVLHRLEFMDATNSTNDHATNDHATNDLPAAN